jgi:cobalt/nickel transport protein
MMEMKHFIIAGIVIALIIGVTAVFLASPDPDGLESTALVVQGEKTLTGDTPEEAELVEDVHGGFSYDSPLPDYGMGESMGKTGELIAVLVGTAVCFLIVLGLAKVAARPQEQENK